VRKLIIAQFDSFCEREQVRKAGALFNKSQTKIKIHEHFPKQIEDKRKRLYPALRKLSELKEKVVLVKDRMFVNNKPFDPDRGTYFDKHGTQRTLSRPINPPKYGEQQGSYTLRPLTKQNNHTHSNQQIRTAGNTPYAKHVIDFTTPNPYDVLSDRREQTKRKERSPLDSEIASKRFTNENSDFQSNAQIDYDKRVLNLDSCSNDSIADDQCKYTESLDEPQPQNTGDSVTVNY
jgi:hypothetical protein